MQIIDKYGYLDGALDYIEKNIVSGRGLHKVANRARLKEDLVKNLSLRLKNFSEKQFLTLLQQKIEDRHNADLGANAEILSVDLSVESENKKLFIWMDLICNIVIDNEAEDKIKINIKIFSKNNIKIYAS